MSRTHFSSRPIYFGTRYFFKFHLSSQKEARSDISHNPEDIFADDSISNLSPTFIHFRDSSFFFFILKAEFTRFIVWCESKVPATRSLRITILMYASKTELQHVSRMKQSRENNEKWCDRWQWLTFLRGGNSCVNNLMARVISAISASNWRRWKRQIRLQLGNTVFDANRCHYRDHPKSNPLFDPIIFIAIFIASSLIARTPPNRVNENLAAEKNYH